MPYPRFIRCFIVFIFSLMCITASGQVIKGTVVSNIGETIPFTSIYLKETTFGTTTNSEGKYEITLPKAGTYTITFQGIGFQKQEISVSVAVNEIKEHNVILLEQVYKLKEVRVYSNNEDPAYRIMRNTIGMAPYYLRQMSHYEADVYLKGSLLVKKIPKLIKRQMDKEDANIEIGKKYTSESMNKIIFDEPDKYDHQVITSRSSFPDNDNEDATMGYITNSFYQPQIDLIISPLSPQAFHHYKFEFIDFYRDGSLYINRIKIIPRRKSQQLVEGYINIIEDLWSIHSINVKQEAFYGTMHVKQTYSPIYKNAWLPTSHFFEVDASILGIKASFNYTSSVKYENTILNDKLPVPETLKRGRDEIDATEKVQQEIANKAKTKNQKKIDELLYKDDLNNRDMVRLARLMEKESSAKSQPDTSMEVIEVTNYNFKKAKKDTLKTDTAYWNTMRPIPLEADEFKAFEIKDSLKLAKMNEEPDTTKTDKKDKKKSDFSKTINGITKGENVKLFDSKLKLTYKGLLDIKNIGFNPVEALWLKQRFGIRIKTDSTHTIHIDPMIKYSFGQERINWDAPMHYNYSPLRRGKLKINIGQRSNDFYGYSSVTPIVNLGYNLLLKDNFSKLYHQNYLHVSNQIDLANGLELHTSLNYAYNERLQNSTNFSFVQSSKEYPTNDPLFEGITDQHLTNQTEGAFEIKLKYTPKHYYKLDKGKKKMLHSKYPTFEAKYRQGVSGIANSTSAYSVIDGTISQTKKWGIFSKFDYMVNGGYFLSNNSMHFSSFKHFNTMEPEFEVKSLTNGFALFKNYEPSTNKWYGQAHLTYTTPHLLLKYLPFFSNRLWLENLYANYLTTPYHKNYTEVGYGISQIFFFAEAAVYGGFNDFEPDSWGIKVVFHFNK